MAPNGFTNPPTRPLGPVLLDTHSQGTEYVIDSVSRDGEHKCVDVFVYDKRPCNNSKFVYFGTHSVCVVGRSRLQSRIETEGSINQSIVIVDPTRSDCLSGCPAYCISHTDIPHPQRPTTNIAGVNLYESPDGAREQRMADYIFKVRAFPIKHTLPVNKCIPLKPPTTQPPTTNTTTPPSASTRWGSGTARATRR